MVGLLQALGAPGLRPAGIIDETLIPTLVVAAIAIPAALWAMIGVAALLRRQPSEWALGATARASFLVVAAALLLATALTLVQGTGGHLGINLGTWFQAGEHRFDLRLLADPLGLAFASLCAVLLAVVSAFADRYLHREPGYPRFFANLSLFAAGILLIALAGTIELIYVGWELVGLASALLIAFFHQRQGPVQSGLWTLVVYRITDLGLLGAAVMIHHYVGGGELDRFLGTGWPEGPSPLAPQQATAVALLLLFAVLGKGAQVPFSGWLPRAMEGPTPSSAIFYGALSVHAGAVLLLRAGPLLDRSPLAAALVVLFGLLTAVHATIVGRVQSDIKSALAYASLTQVGIILVEIGLGLRWIALLHILGHASARALQFLRAPSLLHDLHGMESAVRGHLPRTGGHLERLFPARVRRRLYAASLERWHLDALLVGGVVRPFLRLTEALDRGERRVCAFLGGGSPPPTKRGSDPLGPMAGDDDE